MPGVPNTRRPFGAGIGESRRERNAETNPSDLFSLMRGCASGDLPQCGDFTTEKELLNTKLTARMRELGHAVQHSTFKSSLRLQEVRND